MQIELDTKEALKGLRKLEGKASDLSPLMEDISGMLADITEDAFEGQYDPETGIGWASLDPAYQSQRFRQGTWPGSILQVTGGLATSITTDFGNNFAQIGTNKVYAAAHQFGVKDFSDRSGELVARPFIGFSSQDAEEMEQMISDYLAGG